MDEAQASGSPSAGGTCGTHGSILVSFAWVIMVSRRRDTSGRARALRLVVRDRSPRMGLPRKNLMCPRPSGLSPARVSTNGSLEIIRQKIPSLTGPDSCESVLRSRDTRGRARGRGWSPETVYRDCARSACCSWAKIRLDTDTLMETATVRERPPVIPGGFIRGGPSFAGPRACDRLRSREFHPPDAAALRGRLRALAPQRRLGRTAEIRTPLRHLRCPKRSSDGKRQ